MTSEPIHRGLSYWDCSGSGLVPSGEVQMLGLAREIPLINSLEWLLQGLHRYIIEREQEKQVHNRLYSINNRLGGIRLKIPEVRSGLRKGQGCYFGGHFCLHFGGAYFISLLSHSLELSHNESVTSTSISKDLAGSYHRGIHACR